VLTVESSSRRRSPAERRRFETSLTKSTRPNPHTIAFSHFGWPGSICLALPASDVQPIRKHLGLAFNNGFDLEEGKPLAGRGNGQETRASAPLQFCLHVRTLGGMQNCGCCRPRHPEAARRSIAREFWHGRRHWAGKISLFTLRDFHFIPIQELWTTLGT
jgi:hypothetical protein